MLKCGVRRVDPGRRLLLAAWRWPEGMVMRSSGAWRQPEGTGVRGSVVGNPPGGSVVCLGNEVPLLSGAQGAGLPS